MTRPLSVGITMDDPAGVGPEIVCRALADLSPSNRAQMIVFGTKPILERANALTSAGPPAPPPISYARLPFQRPNQLRWFAC